MVLGTLLMQGLTLKALLRALHLHDGDPVGHEERVARQRMLEAAYSQLPAEDSPAVDLMRKNLKIRLGRLQHVGPPQRRLWRRVRHPLPHRAARGRQRAGLARQRRHRRRRVPHVGE